MLRQRWFVVSIILIVTVIVLGIVQFVSGSAAVMTLVAVLGLLLAIIKLFYSPAPSTHQNRIPSRPLRSPASSSQEKFRKSMFNPRKEDEP